MVVAFENGIFYRIDREYSEVVGYVFFDITFFGAGHIQEINAERFLVELKPVSSDTSVELDSF